jgi:hypothetical protein
MTLKALKTANTLIAAGWSSHAAGAYIEAIEYPSDALDKQYRGMAFNNLAGCLDHASVSDWNYELALIDRKPSKTNGGSVCKHALQNDSLRSPVRTTRGEFRVCFERLASSEFSVKSCC